ncbi:MAG: 2-octaprenyl-6-methoxyphenyl hydroxylase [Pseudomonadota bacterium]
MTAAPLVAVDYDVAIVGGGMVGASLALALRATGLKLLLVEAFAPDAAAQPSFDERTTALGNGSRRVFEALGLWPRLAAEAAPITHIHVSDAGRLGFARLQAAEFDLEALGYVVPNRAIGRELWAALRLLPQVSLAMPARVTQVTLGAGHAELTLQDAKGERRCSARLVVAADGAQSLVRKAAGIAASNEDYGQTAIVATLRTALPNDGTAYERFTAVGPMALLPVAGAATRGGWRTLVWACEPQQAADLLAMDAAQFSARWQASFGWRVGKLLELKSRAAYPLALVRAGAGVAQRAVLLGNASQALHPVAGQGFNLGLRDAAELAEMLAAPAALPDVGAATLLRAFAARRSADRDGVIRFTDGLVKLFADRRPGVAALRDLGLLLFDMAPPAKRALSRVSAGFGGRAPRLSRGLPLR